MQSFTMKENNYKRRSYTLNSHKSLSFNKKLSPLTPYKSSQNTQEKSPQTLTVDSLCGIGRSMPLAPSTPDKGPKSQSGSKIGLQKNSATLFSHWTSLATFPDLWIM